MSNIVRVKPIKKTTWSGFVRYKNTKDHITPYYNQYGVLETGLTKEDEERLGKELKKDLSPQSSFWYDYSIIMTDKERVFNTDFAEQEVAHKLLLAHKRVCNSETEKANWPYADYILYNEEAEAKVKNEAFSTKRKAVTAFNALSTDQMKDILKLYPGFVNSTDSVSLNIIEAKLFELMEKDPAKFIDLVGDKKLEMKIFLKDLVANKILRKNKTAFYYGDDFLGHDEETTITYLDNPEHQSLKIDFKQQLEKAKK